jgi:hypothetical protein
VRLDNLGGSDCTVEDIKLFYNGREALEGMLSVIKEGELYNINRTAAVVEQSKITLKVKLKTVNPQAAAMDFSIQRAF